MDESNTPKPECTATVRLRALPTQLVRATDGVVLVRGATSLKVSGPDACELVYTLLSACVSESATRDELRSLFAATDRECVDQLIDQLLRRRFLISSMDENVFSGNETETSADIFYWNFGARAENVHRDLEQVKLAILGVNEISRALALSLRASGFNNVDVIDAPLVRNMRLFDGDRLMSSAWPDALPAPSELTRWEATLSSRDYTAIIATSDFGDVESMRHWNRICVARKLHFMPVLLRGLMGFIGPITIPQDSACYECLWTRESSNASHLGADLRNLEHSAATRQHVQGFLPPMASLLGELAAIELLKLYAHVMPYQVAALIEVKPLSASVTSRSVLKVPRCPVCSGLVQRGALNLDRLDLVPKSQLFATAELAQGQL
jgi:thiazole/oxazole-forming peptide maturase SagC family component